MNKLNTCRRLRDFITTALVVLGLHLGSCGGGGGGGGAPAPVANPDDLTANFVGTWSVRAQFTGGTGPCAQTAGEVEDGVLVITKNGTSYTVFDGDISVELFVAGNTATFSVTDLGVTLTFDFIVHQNNTRLTGDFTATHAVCTAFGTFTGSRVAPAASMDSIARADERPAITQTVILIEETASLIEDTASTIAADQSRLGESLGVEPPQSSWRLIVVEETLWIPEQEDKPAGLIGSVSRQLEHR